MGVLRRIYFDYAASTPVLKEVLQEMEPYFCFRFGNPGSLHSFGQEAMAAVDTSREIIAKAIDAEFQEIIFTSSATEANNLALRGVVKGFVGPSRIIVSAVEHDSVLETAKDLEESGVEVVYLPVDKRGLIDFRKLEESLNEQTVLVSVMYANNEIGAIQPLAKISKIISDFRQLKVKSQKLKVEAMYPLLHTDAAQAFKCLNCSVKKLGIDLMTLSAHKVYGPKGVGALFVKETAKNLLRPILTGTSQEQGLRSGTENAAGIAGFGKAVQLVTRDRETEAERLRGLGDYFWRELKRAHSKIQCNNDPAISAPHILNLYFPDHLAKDLLIRLDMAGIAVSAGSACSTRSSKPSHVLKALGFGVERITRSLRFSFGKFTTEGEIKEAIKRIRKVL